MSSSAARGYTIRMPGAEASGRSAASVDVSEIPGHHSSEDRSQLRALRTSRSACSVSRRRPDARRASMYPRSLDTQAARAAVGCEHSAPRDQRSVASTLRAARGSRSSRRQARARSTRSGRRRVAARVCRGLPATVAVCDRVPARALSQRRRWRRCGARHFTLKALASLRMASASNLFTSSSSSSVMRSLTSTLVLTTPCAVSQSR